MTSPRGSPRTRHGSRIWGAIVAAAGPPGSGVAEAAAALGAVGHVDAELAAVIAGLVGPETDREVRLTLLRALTDDPGGRSVTGEVLGQRTGDRLADARRAANEYEALVAHRDTTETDLQQFMEQHPWLLGLDYARTLPRKSIVRGTVDFILARFDGFHDLLELKSPQDSIITSADSDDLPPSASKYALSRDLAQALAQVHVYRDALSHARIHEEQFGLRHSRDPRVIIVIGNYEALSDDRRRVLGELNRSLHHVEVVPYDILGNRANATLDNVGRYLIAAAKEAVAPQAA